MGVARVAERVGLRVPVAQAAAAHQALKPEAIFLPAGPKLEFLAGPFPFGSDRNSLLRAFRALKWEARPLQPLSSIDTKGSMWLVQATEDPPDSILPMSHGDVVVTRHKKPREVKDPKPRPVASADTLALCGNNGTDGSKDPWLPSDPWGGFKATTHTLVAADATAGLKQLEDKVTQAVLSSLPAQQVPMERDDLPDRMLMLENQMHSIMEITLLRVIPTMTFIHFVTGKSSGILSDILFGILSGIPSGILSGISSGILPGILFGKSSGILSGISSGILFGKSPGILSGKHSGTLSGIPSGILSGMSSGILPGISSGISSGILSGISSGILSGKSSGILSGKHSGTLSGVSSGILSDILSGILSGIPSGFLSGISSGILSDILSGISSGISSGILSDIPSGISSGILSGR